MRRSSVVPFCISLGISLFGLFVLGPIAAHAAFFGPIIPPACNCDPAGGFVAVNGASSSAPAWGCILATFQNLMSFAVSFAVVIITIFIAWAGFSYMTSGSSAEKRSLANKRIMNAVIGLVIVLCAYLLVDSLMKVIYNPSAPNFGPWNSILAGDGASDCLNPILPQNNLPGVGASSATGGTGVTNSQSTTVPAAGSGTQNTRGACAASALSSTFGNNASAMSCVTNYEDQSCNTAEPSGTDIGADGNVVSFGLFQVNISANNLSQYPACEAAVNNQPLNCTQAFSGGAYTGSNHNTTVSNSSLYATCKTAVKNASCNEQAAQNILSKQGIGAWGTRAQSNCSSLLSN